MTFFGDSICVGAGVSIHKGWVSKVSAKLSEEYSNVLVTNSSVNGRTTREALTTMPYEIQSAASDILIIQFGMNDCNYWETDRGLPRVSKASFKSNLNEIIRRAHRFDVGAVCLNTNHITYRNVDYLSHTSITYQTSNEEYNNIIREVYTENSGLEKLFLCDAERHFKKLINEGNSLNKYLLKKPDLLHLSEEGHEEYYKLIYPLVKEMIKSTQ